MITFSDVKNGVVTLADIVQINKYLDMKQDIEYMVTEESKNANR